MLFVRHTEPPSELLTQTVEWKRLRALRCRPIENQRLAPIPCDTSVSNKPTYRHSLHFSPFQTAVPTKNHRLDHPLQSCTGNAGKSPGVRIQLWARPAQGQDSRPSAGVRVPPSAPGTACLGSAEAAPGSAYPRGTDTSWASRGGHTPAGCHSR